MHFSGRPNSRTDGRCRQEFHRSQNQPGLRRTIVSCSTATSTTRLATIWITDWRRSLGPWETRDMDIRWPEIPTSGQVWKRLNPSFREKDLYFSSNQRSIRLSDPRPRRYRHFGVSSIQRDKILERFAVPILSAIAYDDDQAVFG